MPVVADHTQRIIGLINDKAKEKLKEAAKLVADKARLAVPVDTGELKKSIHVEIGGDNDMVARIIADSLRKTPAKGGPLSYAWYVETGEGSGPAQPYMRPALHSSLKDIERIFNS